MIFAPINPQKARQYFKRRVVTYFISLAGIFLLLSAGFSWGASLIFQHYMPLLLGTNLAWFFASLLLGTASAGLISYYLYVNWNKQPMRIRCPNCRGIVLCRTPWVCGECGHDNWDVTNYTLLDTCENCHLAP